MLHESAVFSEKGYVFHKLARPERGEAVITCLRDRFGADVHFMRLEKAERSTFPASDAAAELKAKDGRVYYRPEDIWLRELVRCITNVETREPPNQLTYRLCVHPGLAAIETTYMLGGWDAVQTIVDTAVKDYPGVGYR